MPNTDVSGLAVPHRVVRHHYSPSLFGRCSNPVTDVRTTPFDMIQTKLIATKTTNSSDDAIIEIVNRHFPCINQPHATITFGLGCDMAKFTMKIKNRTLRKR